MIARASKLLVVLSLAALASASAPPACIAAQVTEQEAVTLKVVPRDIRVGLFYHGTEVRVAAGIPRSDGVIMQIEGGDGDVVLNKKGKLGFIWLNVAQVTVKNAPQVYILDSSGPLWEICSPGDRERLELGFDALAGRIAFESRKPLTGSEFEEFLKLKEHRRTYGAGQTIAVRPAGDGRQEAAATLFLPSAVPPGRYDVRLYCFTRQRLTAQASAVLSIEKVGAPLMMTDLAHRYGAAYGAVAVVIAMAAGILIGFVFGSRRGGGH